MTTAYDLHLARVIAVNEAKTALEHQIREIELHAFRSGMRACGVEPDLCACDWHYMSEFGPDRPMCGGVWLDWTPTLTPRVTP